MSSRLVHEPEPLLHEAALKKHKEMDVVAYENADMGIYFIADPDGYWTEIIPAGKY